MIFRNHKAVLSVLVATALTGAVVTDAFAQSSRSSDRGSRGGSSKQAKAEPLYPNATRKLQKMIDSYSKEKFPETRTQADAILADSASNEYDKSLAAQLASQAAYQTDDTPAAIAYLKQVIQFNGLDNNGHFQSMLMLGQLQLQEDQTAEGLATLDKYFAESKSTKPEELIAKGQALYQLERYQEAIPVLKQAIAGAAEQAEVILCLAVTAWRGARQQGSGGCSIALITRRAKIDPGQQGGGLQMILRHCLLQPVDCPGQIARPAVAIQQHLAIAVVRQSAALFRGQTVQGFAHGDKITAMPGLLD